MTVEPDGGPTPSAEDRPGGGSELVVRPDMRAVTLQAVSRGATVLRTTVPELARRPAVVAALAATATVGTRLAVRMAAELIQSQQRSRATTASVQVAVAPVEVVVHHVVHHVSVPPRPPWPITPGW
jgi:hypothetical protein